MIHCTNCDREHDDIRKICECGRWLVSIAKGEQFLLMTEEMVIVQELHSAGIANFVSEENEPIITHRLADHGDGKVYHEEWAQGEDGELGWQKRSVSVDSDIPISAAQKQEQPK